MRTNRTALFATLLMSAALLVSSPARAASDKGTFGFSVSVESESLSLDPTLKTVTVTKVRADSPAALAGIAVDDHIVEAEGHVVAGAKARQLQPLMTRKVGDTLHLKLARPDGKEYGVTLVAVARKR
jgi:C-terminal processing protease CtpA/Prc